MKRRTFISLVLFIVAAIALVVYPYNRPRTIQSFESPDGRWELIVRDIDSGQYQVMAEFSIRRKGAWSDLPGQPIQMYCDSADPNLARPVWTNHDVHIGMLH